LRVGTFVGTLHLEVWVLTVIDVPLGCDRDLVKLPFHSRMIFLPVLKWRRFASEARPGCGLSVSARIAQRHSPGCGRSGPAALTPLAVWVEW
jgi:hypothetical protein